MNNNVVSGATSVIGWHDYLPHRYDMMDVGSIFSRAELKRKLLTQAPRPAHPKLRTKKHSEKVKVIGVIMPISQTKS